MKTLALDLNGKNTLHNLPNPSYIYNLANFIFFNPVFFDLFNEIMHRCWNKEEYLKFKDFLLTDPFGEYDSSQFQRFKELIEKFYDESGDVENDRGKIVERIAEIGIRRRYKKLKLHDIKFHCKLSVSFRKTNLTCSPHDVDVCGKIKLKGDYVECKLRLTEISSGDMKKVEKLTKVKSFLESINKTVSTEHDLYFLVLDKNDSEKLKYYHKTWPGMTFIGMDKFQKVFL